MPVINPLFIVAGSLSAGTTKATLGEVVFSNSNGVSFGIDGQTITASVVAGGGDTGSIFAGTTRLTLGEAVFSNSNGLSFGVNGQTITGSYTVPSVAGLLSNINVSAGTTSQNLSNVVFSNSNNVSFGLDGSTVTASISVATSLTNIRVSAGTTSNLLSAITFNNANGVSFGLDASTLTASIVTSLTNIRVSAGTTSNLLSAITFSNSNNVSFGINASTITASVNTSLTNINVSAGTTSNNLSAITFSNSNGVSFGLNGSTLTGSVATSLTNIRVSAGTTSNLLSAITFSNSNGISFGLDASTITASYTVPGTLSVFATSNTTQSTSGTIPFNSLIFNGAGIASVGVTNGSVVVSVPAGGGAGDGGVFAGVSTFGNTNGSTGTVSTGNFVLVGSHGISLSQSTGAVGSNATVTIYDAVLSEWNRASIITAAGSNLANSSCSIVPFRLDRHVSASQFRFYISISAATQTNTSSAGFVIGWSGVIYSRNVGTLSSLNSFSNSTSTFHQSNSTSSVANVRGFTASFATASLFTAGVYWVALHVSTTTSGQTSLAKGVSVGIVPTVATAFGAVNYLGSNTTGTRGVFPGLAVHSTNATIGTIAFTDITGHSGNSASLANVWFELRNVTVW